MASARNPPVIKMRQQNIGIGCILIRGVNRAGPNNFNSLAIRAGSSRIFMDPGRIQLKDKLKTIQNFLFY